MAKFTQEQLDAIESAIAEGALIVKYRDREVTYRSLNEMLKIRDMMLKDLGQVAKTDRRLSEFSKGLE